MARVLIADDDASIRETLRMLLEEDGHSVVEAVNGQTTLATLRADTLGYVALLDLLMPDTGHLALLQTIAQDSDLARRHAYIILSAGTEAMLDGAAPLVTALGGSIVRKPFSIDEVSAKVHEAARRLDTR